MSEKLSRSEQARINGAKSRGPVTETGKANSSRNALKHGLTAQAKICLENESGEDYQRVRNRWITELHPATEAQLSIVNRIAAADWRLERTVALQTRILQHEIDASGTPELDDLDTLAASTRDTSRPLLNLDLLRRYETALERSFAANIKLLRDLQRAHAAAVPAAPQPAKPTHPFPALSLRNEPGPREKHREINALDTPNATPEAA